MDNQPEPAPKQAHGAESAAPEGKVGVSASVGEALGSDKVPGGKSVSAGNDAGGAWAPWPESVVAEPAAPPREATPIAAPTSAPSAAPASAAPAPAATPSQSAAAASAPSRPAADQRRPSQQAAKPGATERNQREALLKPTRIEPWSVMRVTFAVSLIGWLVLNVIAAVLYYGLASHHIFHTIESVVGTLRPGKGNNAANWFSASTILGYTMLAGAIEVFVVTALATVGTVVYNLVTDLTGGIEVTLREAD
jgi:hypothetical protein